MFNTKNEFWQRVQSNVIFIAFVELLMIYYGFDAVFCLDVFLMGILYCLYVEWSGNFWISSGAHTGWNYTLLWLIGPGEEGDFPALIGGSARSNIWFYGDYGFQGSISAAMLMTLLIFLMIYLIHRRREDSSHLY